MIEGYNRRGGFIFLDLFLYCILHIATFFFWRRDDKVKIGGLGRIIRINYFAVDFFRGSRVL